MNAFAAAAEMLPTRQVPPPPSTSCKSRSSPCRPAAETTRNIPSTRITSRHGTRVKRNSERRRHAKAPTVTAAELEALADATPPIKREDQSLGDTADVSVTESEDRLTEAGAATPETVRAIADAGHEVLSHSYAMDVIPALLSDEDERKNVRGHLAIVRELECGTAVAVIDAAPGTLVVHRYTPSLSKACVSG